jgi:hypothetical protein
MATAGKDTAKKRSVNQTKNVAAKKARKPQLKTSPERIAKIIAGLQRA